MGEAAARESKVAQQFLEMAESDWAKALLLLCTAPLFPVWLAFAHFHLYDDSLLATAWQWPWTNIVLKAQLLGIFYVFVDVGCMKMTTVALAMTNETLSTWPVATVCITIFLIGTFLFLLPPTPGPPVYMVTGIVVTASAMREELSFAAALALATFVGFAIKLSFVAIALKGIGLPLGGSVSVRRMVGVHTVEIRAIETILGSPTLTLPKVLMLVGGPDWPVAVMCGIMNLDLGQILLGTSPVLVQGVFPCVLSGALLFVAGDDAQTKAMAETCLGVAAGLQVVTLFLACYYVQEIIETDHERLRIPRESDREVIQLEEETEAQARIFERETAWESLGVTLRVALLVGFVCIEIAIILIAGPWEKLAGAGCFRPFGLMDSVAKELDGNALAIVEPLGWVALGFFSCSAAAVAVFYAWAKLHIASLSEGDSSKRSEGEALLKSA